MRACVQDPPIWSPSAIINRFGKEIANEESVYYWCWKVHTAYIDVHARIHAYARMHVRDRTCTVLTVLLRVRFCVRNVLHAFFHGVFAVCMGHVVSLYVNS